MERYLVFAGEDFYPAGGWHDCLGGFDSVEIARSAIRGEAGGPSPCIRPGYHKWYGDGRWYHIVDTETGKIVQKEGYAEGS